MFLLSTLVPSLLAQPQEEVAGEAARRQSSTASPLPLVQLSAHGRARIERFFLRIVRAIPYLSFAVHLLPQFHQKPLAPYSACLYMFDERFGFLVAPILD